VVLHRAAAIVGVLGLGLGACGVFLGGPDEMIAAGDSGPLPDGAIDGAIDDVSMMHDVVTLPETGMDCDAGAMATATMLVLAGASGCPMGTMEEDLVTNPVADAGACTCGACMPTMKPQCNGMSTWTWGGTNQCSPGNKPFTFTDSQCLAQGGNIPNLAAYNQWSTLTPSAGTCTAMSQADNSKVGSTPLARCIVPAMRQDILCGAELAGGYKFCVPANDGGCSAPYTDGVIAGSATTLGCTDCGCTLTASSCTIEYHHDANCTTLLLSRTMDNTCTATNGVGPIDHFKIFAANPQCTPTPGSAKTGLANSTRMCCTP
jgi:hypothetical protein